MRTYGKLDFSDGYWHIQAEPHVIIRLKQLFAKVVKQRRLVISLKSNPHTAKDLEWFLYRYPLEMDEAAQKQLHKNVSKFNLDQADMERILLPTYKPQALDLILPLRKYQAVAVDLLRRKKKLLVGDDVGLGKTVIGIGGCIGIEGALPALVVCQTHLPGQWQDQFKKFSPKTNTHIIHTGKVYNLPPADVYLISYSKLSKWLEVLNQGFLKFVIFDEVQELRVPDSQKHQAAVEIALGADYCLGLSATPVYNYGSEIFTVLNAISPECLGDWDEFAREWCGGYSNNGKLRVKDPKVLGSYLRENFLMLRRTRNEVGEELPDVNKIVETVEYDHKVALEHEALLASLSGRLLDKTTAFTEKGQLARELDMKVRYLTGVAKAKNVAEYVKQFLDNGERVLLAGWHRDVYKLWLRELEEYNPVLYTGSESPKKKAASKEAFVKGDSQVMLISLRSGVGLDGLQHTCNTVVFGEMDWSPGVHEQVIGRVHRGGQQQKVTAVFITSDYGSDPLMIDLLGVKAVQAHGIVNPHEESLVIGQTADDRIKQLAERLVR